MTDGKVAVFVWTIKHFDMCPHLTGEWFYSPEFKIGSYQFCLVLYPRGPKDSNYVSVFLKRLTDCGAPEIWVNFEFSLIGNTASNYIFVSTRHNLKKLDSWGYCNLIKRDTLLTNKRTKFLINNDLTIRCDLLSLSEHDQNTFMDDPDAERLSVAFREILEAGIYSDMVLIINDNKFNVHKSVLKCRCPKLISHLKETELPDEYTLDDIEAHVLPLLLQYLYTGTFNVANVYEEMLIASDTYCIPDLRNLLIFPYYNTIRATTEITVSKLSFRWVINNFSQLQVNDTLVYPEIHTTCHEWSTIKVVGTVIKNENGSTGLNLKFRKLTSDNKVGFIRCKISIAKKKLKTTIKEYEHIFTSGEEWLTPFGSEVEIDQILLNDTLDVFFEISMSKKGTNSEIKEVFVGTIIDEEPEIVIVKNLKLIQKDLASLFDNESNSGDITMKVGDVNYTVHKFILCARSPVFAKMFENDTLEKKEGVVTIQDIDAQTVSSMLRYIYTGCIDEIGISEAINLYAAADKYELLTLKDKCSDILKTFMDADHIGKILLLADAHHDNNLSSSVYDYMTSNPDKVLASKDGLSVLKNRLDVCPDIINALLKHVSSNLSE